MLPHRAFVLLSLLSLALATQLYRYGTDEGDQEIEFSSEPSAMSLDVPIIYFEETQNEIFISSNGLLSFGRPVSGSGIKDLDTERLSAIAVFYVPTSGGTIYYRATSSDNDLLNDLTDRIRRNFPRRDSTEFRALHAILVTWDAMTASDAKGVNEYQLALVTDGLSSYAVFLYNRIDWTTSDGRIAQAGLYYSDGRRQSMVNSGTVNIKELVNLSNNQKEGSYIFRISGSSPEDPRGSVEDDYTYNDYEPEYDPDENVRRPQQPPSHQRPVETLSENDINHDIEPAYHRMHASIVHPEESPTEASERANAIEEQPNGESQPIEIMPDVHPQPQEMPQIVLQLPPQPEPEPTQKSASDLHETSSEHTGVEDERYKEQQKQHVETTEEDIPDDSRVDAPPTFTRTSAAEREMLLSCAEASETMQPCHTHARCIDYHPGYCCECLHGYYGNGKECLKSGDPQRINGGFEGVINGEAIGRTELHTYVMTAEGRAYTALSQIPPHHGRSLLLLNPIGGAMGWLFAKVESPSSYNGFQLTGGLFNRTVNVHIGDRSAVTIKQQFSGRDIYHYFKAQIFVTGTLPQLAENVEVIYPDHEEEYRREGPGFVRSYSAHDVLVKENGHERTMRLTIDQQIHYKECPYKAFDKDSVVVLRVSRPHVIYDAEERIVRYASANSATNERSLNLVEAAVPEPQEPSRTRSQQPVQKSKDPCGQGNHVCTLPNMFCTAVEPSYRCECERGFQAQPDASTHLGWKCIDLDECQRGDHTCDQNAICANTDGGFNCECRPGYQGDGHRCHRIGESIPREDTSTASECHSHQECHQWGECAFGRNGEAGYCRCRGWYVGDGVHHCGPPDEQPRLAVTEMPQRQENTGNLCGGYICDSNADCMPAPRGGDECVCRSGFHGNGVQCAPHAETMRPIVYPVGLGSICRAHDECGEHGNCVYGTDVGYYRCVCVPPYRSDGIQCVKDETAVGTQYCDTLNNCGDNAECVHDTQSGHYICKCIDGFDGDGYSCIPIYRHTPSELPHPSDVRQTCREATDCHRNAHCVVRENSFEYYCECLPGFKGDGVNVCKSADECTPTDAHSCHEHAECVYGQVEGAYICKCVQGFAGDGRMCTPHARPSTCDVEPTVCHVNAQCVYNHDENRHICICKPGSVGDGYVNCEIQETPRCGRCSAHASCVQRDSGAWECECNPGYQGNGHVCSPFTSCLDDRSICDPNAECVPGEHGYYVCNCHYGYHGNGRTCLPDSENREEVLLIGRGMTVIQRGTNPEIYGKQLVVIPHQIVVGLDFDCQEERIVWSDISGHALRSASLNGTDEKKFMESVLQSPEGIAIDWSSRNVYYADSVKDEIGVASLDGKYQKTLINEGLVNPRALAIDLRNRHLYYSDWHRENPLIGRVDLDGRNNIPFVNNELYLPNGLTVLEERRELCWVDAGMQRLSCIGLDGRNRRVVFAPLEYPFGLTTHNEQRFYWTDWKDNQIHSVSIYGDGYLSFPATIGGSGRLYGIASVPLQCKGTPTACAVNNGGCQYMCLPGTTQVRCACPDNIEDLEGC